jgi:hypothetical protein
MTERRDRSKRSYSRSRSRSRSNHKKKSYKDKKQRGKKYERSRSHSKSRSHSHRSASSSRSRSTSSEKRREKNNKAIKRYIDKVLEKGDVKFKTEEQHNQQSSKSSAVSDPGFTTSQEESNCLILTGFTGEMVQAEVESLLRDISMNLQTSMPDEIHMVAALKSAYAVFPSIDSAKRILFVQTLENMRIL